MFDVVLAVNNAYQDCNSYTPPETIDIFDFRFYVGCLEFSQEATQRIV